MATIKIDRFGGISPRTHPTLLQDGMAVVAENVRLKNGKIVPLREPVDNSTIKTHLEGGIRKLSDAESIHVWRMNDGSAHLVAYPGMTWMSRGNLADDEKSRVVVSGDTGVSFVDDDGVSWDDAPQILIMDGNKKVVHQLCKNKLENPIAVRVMGELVTETQVVSRGFHSVSEVNSSSFGTPSNGWTVVVTDSGTISNGELGVVSGTQIFFDGSKWILADNVSSTSTVRYTYFFWTWVDKYGYESPVSEQSREITYNDGDYISISAPSSMPKGAEAFRIYKVVTGTEQGRIQFICEVSRDDMSKGVSVCVKDEDAGEVIPEIERPSPDLRCILDVPGGFYCGFSKSKPKTVCFSDVDLLYSWPIAYQYDVKDNIVALAVTSNTVFALTDGWPYVLSGTSPEGMTVSKLAGPSACVSERGVCVYKNAVYFAGNAGLMTIYNNSDSGTVCENLTDKIFTKDQWNAFNPSSCVMGQHDGALFLFFTLSDGSHKGLTIDLSETAAAVTTHDEYARCLCVDDATDRMYFVKEA